MPVYEYKCRECGAISEYRSATTAASENLTCKSCGSSQVERKISVPSISTGKSAPPSQTCCGRDQRCSDAGSCCGH